MAMLAEPKKKLRWSLNPRGNLWANDGNKFGQKMLEKMGWSKGKGLGKDENGIIEHVKVAQKNDLKGIGWNDSDGNWIAHQTEFNDILTSLNEGIPQEVIVTENLGSCDDSCTATEVSLEKRSKNFKSRVHHQKFLRGKDVRQYSEQDMDCIFGAKFCADNSEPNESGEDKSVLFTSENQSANTDDNVPGVKLHKSHTSISDYFAQKMKQKKLSHQNAAHKSSSSSTIDSPQKVDFKEEILLGNIDEVSTFPVMATEIMKKRNKETVQDPCSALKSFNSASSITSNPLTQKELLSRIPPKKRLYVSETEVSEKVYTKHIKKYPEQHVTVSPQQVLKSCLKNIPADDSSVNVKKGVRFRDEQLVSYAENACMITESADSEHSTLNISLEHHTTVLNTLQNSTSIASSDKWDKMSEIHSGTELIDCMGPCQKLNFLSNNKTLDTSEKLAKKFKHYKKVSKCIREHDVFSTTNILEIKGYGNW